MIILKIVIAVFLGAIGQVFFKLGSASFKGGFFDHIILFLTNKFLFFGLTLYGISTLIYVTALQKIPLSLAYPLISIGYIFVLFFSYFFLGEALSLSKILGTLIIISGVCVLCLK
jgi:multidrug transporter EmrE-like cation transporter